MMMKLTFTGSQQTPSSPIGIEAEGASGAGAPRTLIDSFIVASITGDAARKRGVCYRLATKNSGKHVNPANF